MDVGPAHFLDRVKDLLLRCGIRSRQHFIFGIWASYVSIALILLYLLHLPLGENF